MNTSRPTLRINVGFLLNQPKGTYRDIPVDLPEIQITEDVSATQLQGNVRISRTYEGLLVQGDFRTHIMAPCSRCLEDTDQTLHAEFTELYVFPKFHNYQEPDEDEPELVVPEDGYIDLEPLLRDYLMLEIPINPLCRADCKGLCPECGVNLNETTCEHIAQPAENDPSETDS